MLVFEESVGSDLFCWRMWNKLFLINFSIAAVGEFLCYFIFSVFHKLCVDGWMDGWWSAQQNFSPLWMDDHVGLLKTPSMPDVVW
jgi:hypothetical protein